MTEIKQQNLSFSSIRQVPIAPLVVFRVIFGSLMLFGTIRFISKGWVESLYIQPNFFFTYYGFEWVKPLVGNWMYLPFVLMILAAIGIILGAFYRWSAGLFFFCFTYVELLDKSNYLNHYYFVSLMAFILLLVPAHKLFSLDVYWKKVKAQSTIASWPIQLIQFQVACVYLFAGIAKLNSDWLLKAQPLSIWLQAHRDMPFFGNLLQERWVAYSFSWFGCFYDLFIVFFLLWNKTRKMAYLLVIIFHLLTWFLFPIGVFPWVMIFSTLIFFPADFHEKILRFLRKTTRTKVDFTPKVKAPTKSSSLLKVFLVLYISAQILVPFRYLLYPGNLFWNEEGFRFSWRVMLMHKDGFATFYVHDKKSGGEIEINNNTYLSEHQIDQMATQPDMILQYAHFLKKTYKDTLLHYTNQTVHLTDPSIKARVLVNLNGRNSHLFVDKKHDLSLIPYNLAHRNWVEAYKE
jgi:hypothetical protein